MNCIILAGGSPAEDDPLYLYTGNRPKALLTVGDKTMLHHVIDAVRPVVDEIMVVGIRPNPADDLPDDLIYISDHGDIVHNVEAGLKEQLVRFGRNHTLIVTADLPLLTTEAVAHFIAICQPLAQLGYYSMVTKDAIAAQYPHPLRTFSRLRDHTITGGNLAILHTDLLTTNLVDWGQLVRARKSALKLAWRVGPIALLKLATRRLTVADTGAIASRLFDAPLTAIISPYAEIAMDVDKPHHLALARENIAKSMTTV